MNLTQHQKDDYLIYIKGLSNSDLLAEYIDLLYSNCQDYFISDYVIENYYKNWCEVTCYNELRLRLGDWLDE